MIHLKQCSSCFDQHHVSDFFKCSTDCRATLCSSCLDKFFSLNESYISCPSCRKHLAFEDFLIIFKGNMQKASIKENIISSASLNGDDIFYCCYPDCNGRSSVDQNEGEQHPIRYCHECHRKSCYICKKPWHENHSCNHVQTNYTEENRLSEETIQRTTKKCPGCRVNIEKDQGCDHMTCRCSHKFNWSSV